MYQQQDLQTVITPDDWRDMFHCLRRTYGFIIDAEQFEDDEWYFDRIYCDKRFDTREEAVENALVVSRLSGLPVTVTHMAYDHADRPEEVVETFEIQATRL
jgi:hypothetical protein